MSSGSGKEGEGQFIVGEEATDEEVTKGTCSCRPMKSKYEDEFIPASAYYDVEETPEDISEEGNQEYLVQFRNCRNCLIVLDTNQWNSEFYYHRGYGFLCPVCQDAWVESQQETNDEQNSPE